MPFNGLHSRSPCNCMDYYSFTDPEGMEGWVGMVGWPIVDTLARKWSLVVINCRSGIDQGKSASQTDALATEPRQYSACVDVAVRLLLMLELSRGPHTWTFGICPPENECTNEHHNCSQNEKCSDTTRGFSCNCKLGYMRNKEYVLLSFEGRSVFYLLDFCVSNWFSFYWSTLR